MERKRDLVISWRYASLTMIRGGWGGNKAGFYSICFFSTKQESEQRLGIRIMCTIE